jgi:hypothetical protein
VEERGENVKLEVREFEDGRYADCIRKGEKPDMDKIKILIAIIR